MKKIRIPAKLYFQLPIISQVIVWLLLPLMLALILIATMCYCLTHVHLLHNISSSEPLGRYLVYPSNTILAHQLRTVCLSNTRYIGIVGQLGLKKDLQSICENGYVPLLKKVVAIPNDTVAITQYGVFVNSEYIRNSKQLQFAHGVDLSPQPESIFKLHFNEYFVMGNESHSYDSRYFGIVHAHEMQYRAVLLMKD